VRLTAQYLAIRDSVVDVRAVVRLSLQDGRPNAPCRGDVGQPSARWHPFVREA
jgi:hypothetical protein